MTPAEKILASATIGVAAADLKIISGGHESVSHRIRRDLILKTAVTYLWLHLVLNMKHDLIRWIGNRTLGVRNGPTR